MDLIENFQKKIAAARDSYITQPATAVGNWWDDLRSVTRNAIDEADKRFPDQEDQMTQKNAFRHSLGAGRFAQLLGANSGIPGVVQGAQLASKLAGYTWEGVDSEHWNTPDSRHDLNNNSFGIDQAVKNQGYAELANSLESFARGARSEPAPQPFVQGKPYLTYTK